MISYVTLRSKKPLMLEFYVAIFERYVTFFNKRKDTKRPTNDTLCDFELKETFDVRILRGSF